MTTSSQKKDSYAEQYLLKHSCVFTLVYGHDAAGARMYFYLAVAADKWDDFKAAMKTEHFNARNFGAVLYSDYGEPTETVQKTIEEYYGITLADLGAVA